MRKTVQWIKHKGRDIMLVDFSGIRDETEYLGAFDEMEAEVLAQPPGRMMLTLTDVTDTTMTPAITERSKRMVAAAREAGIPDSPTAMVGLTGFQKAVVQAMQFFRDDLYVASDIEAAKDWLVEQV